MVSKSKQKEYYNKKNEPIAYWTEGIPMPHFFPNIVVFKKLLGDVEGKDILDFGCGCGQFSYYLSKRGGCVTAIDISKKNIDDLRRLAIEKKVTINTIVASVDMCPFKDELFDVIFGSAILHHLELSEEKRACYEVYRMLKKDGMAIFIEPLENSPKFRRLIEYIPVSR